MKKAGAWRGIDRARKQAWAFSFAQGVAGFFWTILLAILLQASEVGDIMGYLIFAHFILVVALWPGAVLTNFMLLRLWKHRSWRHQEWRAWVAGIAAMPLTVLGLIASERLLGVGSQFLTQVLGTWAYWIQPIGVIILMTNLAIGLGWALPSRRHAGVNGERKICR